MRCVLLTAALVALMGCGHSAADKIAIHNLKDEIRELEEFAESKEASAYWMLEDESFGFDEEQYRHDHRSVLFGGGEPTEEEIATARKLYKDLSEEEADRHHRLAAEYREKAEAKRELLREIE